ncbi:MAG: hypothetical protein U9N77_01560 [Thermodesulfobacteriota bacterium]|nr:hypothetical protein [Thermodesulfobacteriota bacterium]
MAASDGKEAGKEAGKGQVKGRTTGQFRCLYCFKHLAPPRGATEFTCPNCGYAWRVWWFNPGEPRIRGPVWDNHEKLTKEKMQQQGGA